MKVTGKAAAGSPSSSSLPGEEAREPDGKALSFDRAENGIKGCERGGVSAVDDNSSGAIDPLVDGNGEVLEDSEMNGVSSLLEMQQSGGFPGLDSVLQVIDKNERKGLSSEGDGGEKEGELGLAGGEAEGKGEEKEGSLEEGDEMGELDYDVGDFVWGKIKSHPWWPGRVYDPLDASEQAKKVRHGEDRILVAYFGDGTFAWCNPSQLRPFHANFEEMASQSASKNFVNAVEKALEEVGRSVDLSLTCSCVPRDNLFGFGRSLAANAGVKDGLLVPEGGDFFDNDLFNPENVFHSIKNMSKVVTFGNALELVIVKSSLSAFYRAKGGSKLQAFYEPTEIPGLEDDSRMMGGPSNQQHSLVECTFSGPVKEECVSSSHGQDSQNLSHKPQVFAERLAPRRRKQKSIAEIISGNPNAEAEAEAEASGSKTVSRTKKATSRSEGDDAVENPELSGSKKRKARSSPKVTERATTEARSSDPSPSSSRAKKSKASGEVASSKSENTQVLPSGSRRSKRGKEANAVEAASESVSGLRKRKDREVPESPVPAADHVTSAIDVNSPPSRRRKKQEGISVVNDGSHGRTEEAMGKKTNGGSSVDDNKGKQTSENIALSRERKKSRYLSPPYTNITIGQRPKMKVWGESRLAEDNTEAANEAKSGEKLSKERAVVDEKPDDLIAKTSKDQTSTIEARAAASEVLCHIRAVALDPLHVEESKHLDQVLGFVSELRSAGHDGEGSNSERNIKPKRGRKKKKLQERSESDPTSPYDRKSRQNEEFQNSEKPVAATLYVTFGPGSSLPSKDDLLRIYGPFGALNKDETDMLYNNRCARIAFSSVSEAEEALSHSQRSSPFGASHVNFRLRFPSSSTGAKRTAPNPVAGEPSSELHCVIEKLEMVDSMLKSSSSEVSAELKSRVEDEIRGVIAKLNTMVRPSGSS